MVILSFSVDERLNSSTCWIILTCSSALRPYMCTGETQWHRCTGYTGAEIQRHRLSQTPWLCCTAICMFVYALHIVSLCKCLSSETKSTLWKNVCLQTNALYIVNIYHNSTHTQWTGMGQRHFICTTCIYIYVQYCMVYDIYSIYDTSLYSTWAYGAPPPSESTCTVSCPP